MPDPDESPTDTTSPEDGAVFDDAAGLTEAESADTQRALDQQRDKYLRLAAEYDNLDRKSVV